MAFHRAFGHLHALGDLLVRPAAKKLEHHHPGLVDVVVLEPFQRFLTEFVNRWDDRVSQVETTEDVIRSFATGFYMLILLVGLQGIPDFVSNPGGFFLVSATASLLGGTVFLIWLSEQITQRGMVHDVEVDVIPRKG